MTEKGLSSGSAVDLGVHCGEGDAAWCHGAGRIAEEVFHQEDLSRCRWDIWSLLVTVLKPHEWKSAGILQQFQWGPGGRALRTQLSADPENRNKFICSVKRKCGDLIRWRKRSKSELASEEQQEQKPGLKNTWFVPLFYPCACWVGGCLPASPLWWGGARWGLPNTAGLMLKSSHWFLTMGDVSVQLIIHL